MSMWGKSGEQKPYPEHLSWKLYSALQDLVNHEDQRAPWAFVRWDAIWKLEKLGLVAQSSTKTGLVIMVTRLGLECLADNH